MAEEDGGGSGGLMALQGYMGLASYYQKKDIAKYQKKVAAFNNKLTAANYANTLISINQNETLARDNYFNSVISAQNVYIQGKGQLATATAFTGTAGKTKETIGRDIKALEGKATYKADKTYEYQKTQYALNRASAYINKMGSHTFNPVEPSLVSELLGSGIAETYMKSQQNKES